MDGARSASCRRIDPAQKKCSTGRRLLYTRVRLGPLPCVFLWAGSIFWNGALSKTFFYGVLLRGEMNMRALMVTFLAGAGALIASSAYAADEVQAGESSPLLHQARVVCNDTGQCWHSRGDRRVIIGDGYDGYYGSRRYYDYDRDYYREPGIGVYGPGFSFGVGRGW